MSEQAFTEKISQEGRTKEPFGSRSNHKIINQRRHLGGMNETSAGLRGWAEPTGSGE